MKPEDITAWALDELTPEERAQVEAALADTPAAQQQARDTKAFCQLLSEHLIDDDAALTNEQREALKALDLPQADNVLPFAVAEEAALTTGSQPKVTAARERVEPKRSMWMRIAALAACLVLTVVVINQPRTPNVAPAKVSDTFTPTENFVFTPDRPEKAAVRQKIAPVLQPAQPALADISNLQKSSEITVGGTRLQVTNPTPGAGSTTNIAMMKPESSASSISLPTPEVPAPTMASAAAPAAGGREPLILSGSNTYTGGLTINGGTAVKSGVTFNGAATLPRGASGSVMPAGAAGAGGSTITFGGTTANPSNGRSSTTGTVNGIVALEPIGTPASPPAPTTYSGVASGMAGPLAATDSEKLAKQQSEYYNSARDHVRAKMIAQVDTVSPRPDVAKDRAEKDGFRTYTEFERKSAVTRATPTPGTQRYAPIIENPFTTVTSQPLSTFSIDVDTASYANVRRFLNARQLPPPDAVRLEELINYFPYDYEPAGKDQPFSVHVDLAEAPWAPEHRLARVAIKGRDVGQERPAANFVFLIDVSGSMDSPERLPLVKQSLEMLTEQLRDDDHVSIVTYAGACAVALKSTSGKDKAWIMEVIRSLQAGGSTNGESGIRMAYEQAAQNFVKDGINRVILCTDGDFNVGMSSVQQLKDLIKDKARGGTFLSVLGFGTDNLQDHTMETLADNGNGNYAYIDSLGEARKVLVEQMHGTLITIAKDVKIQVEFNPAQVASYRLIGYEKRMLAAADFNNDKKDAGEIGAGHTITALYELVPAGVPMANGALAEVDALKYQKKEQPKSPPVLDAKPPQQALEGLNDEALTVKLRYKAPDGQVSKLIEVPVRDTKGTLKDSPRDFRFATAVAGFGMLLRGSEHVEDFSFEAVRRLALEGKGEDALGYRGEFIQLIDKARGLAESR